MIVFCDTLNKLFNFISLALSFWMIMDMILANYYIALMEVGKVREQERKF